MPAAQAFTPQTKAEETALRFSMLADGSVCVSLGSGWDRLDTESVLTDIEAAIGKAKAGSRLVFENGGLDRHDALVVSSVLRVIRAAEAAGLEADVSMLPDALSKLVRLSLVVPLHTEEAKPREDPITRLGRTMVSVIKESRGFFEFTGELVYAFGRLLTGKARFRKADFWITLEDCGVAALPIVGLISLLIGIILGYVAGVQLQLFGATIFMVDLVGLAMAREMGCIMTGVIMSGRSGAAFAAQIGSMNVNQEVDAYETLGLSPMEFLVLPRAMAMILMMPLLTLFSDVLGWFGGFLVALPLDISAGEYWMQLTGSMSLRHISVGIIKSFFFGVIVAAAGCYYGLRSGRNSAAVGEAATRAVVAGITWIIVLDAVFAFVLQIIGL